MIKDYFSTQSKSYYLSRPHYPNELYKYLSLQLKEHNLAWDCGTGNGQAAESLSRYFKQVYATDLSLEQINLAKVNPKITYAVEVAEKSSLKSNSVDLICVAQAIHWFNLDAFYTEARRVLKQDGMLAAWTYGLPRISNEIDAVVKDFHDNLLAPFWRAENGYVNSAYKDLPFPFQQIETPLFYYQKEARLNEFLELLQSWSAVQHFIELKNENPVGLIEHKLKKLWGTEKRRLQWTICLKLGKNL